MKLTVALDWTPNTLQAGLWVAQAEGYFKEKGLTVELISPEEDQYAITPGKRLAQKQVQIAIGPSETVISYNTLGENSVPLVGIAAMLQQDTSALVTLKERGITRPAQLDGKIVGSYGARFEDEIVRQLVITDGGKGNFTVKKPEKLSMWQHLKEGSVDAAWVFMPWEGILAAHEQLVFNVFQLGNFGIPYGYSPLLITHQDFIRDENKALRAFIAAVEQGWKKVKKDPRKASRRLKDYITTPAFQDEKLIRKSLEQIVPSITNERGQWGFMEGYHWIDFVDWMIENQILKDTQGIPMNHGQIDTAMLYTNEFFK